MERGTFKQVWPATGTSTRSDREGRLDVTVPPLSAVVLRAAGTVAEREAAPAAYFRTPSAGGTVGGRQEVAVSVPEGGFNQVSIAWRHAGADDWTALGTDDNAPYRVFHDLSGLPQGTLLEYRAVLRDSTGNLSVASTYATVGKPASGGGGGGDTGGGGPVTQPSAVSMPGSHNGEIGCAGDWMPACDQAQMSLDPADSVWKATVDVPAGTYEYKAAIDRGWDENYGAGGAPGGANIPLDAAGGPVSFYYDHATHYATTDAEGPIVTAAGSFQDELGCPSDWTPGLHGGLAPGPRRRRDLHVRDDPAPGRLVPGEGHAWSVVERELRGRRCARWSEHRLRRPLGRRAGAVLVRRRQPRADRLQPSRGGQPGPVEAEGAVAARGHRGVERERPGRPPLPAALVARTPTSRSTPRRSPAVTPCR